jgi:hypothetical protein
LDPDPDTWTVAVCTRDPDDNGRRRFSYNMGTVDFLTGLLTGTLEVPLGVNLHGGGPNTPQTFESWREFDLQVLAEYPDYKGNWADAECGVEWFDLPDGGFDNSLG